MITDVDRDGCQVGFDKNFFEIIKEFIKVPTIISGGCANFNDFLFAFNFKSRCCCFRDFFLST